MGFHNIIQIEETHEGSYWGEAIFGKTDSRMLVWGDRSSLKGRE